MDREALATARQRGDIVGAELLLKRAYEEDVTPLLAQWRRSRGLPDDPLKELRSSGLIARLGRERAARRKQRGDHSAASYA